MAEDVLQGGLHALPDDGWGAQGDHGAEGMEDAAGQAEGRVKQDRLAGMGAARQRAALAHLRRGHGRAAEGPFLLGAAPHPEGARPV